MVAGHSKLGAVAAYRFCSANEVQMLITDTGANNAAIHPFEEMGIEVRRV